MKFYEITEDQKASPGEYILHEPTRQIVLCGSYNKKNNQIKALANGGMLVDKIENFKKIALNEEERAKRSKPAAGCQKCGK